MAQLGQGTPARIHFEEWFERNLARLAGALSLQKALEEAFAEGAGYAELHHRSVASDTLALIRDHRLTVTPALGVDRWVAGVRDESIPATIEIVNATCRVSPTLVGAIKSAADAVHDAKAAAANRPDSAC